jgi:hypothetical protein
VGLRVSDQLYFRAFKCRKQIFVLEVDFSDVFVMRHLDGQVNFPKFIKVIEGQLVLGVVELKIIQRRDRLRDNFKRRMLRVRVFKQITNADAVEQFHFFIEFKSCDSLICKPLSNSTCSSEGFRASMIT